MDGGSLEFELRDSRNTYLKIFLGAAEPEDRNQEANRFIVAADTGEQEESRQRSFGSLDARTTCIWLTAVVAQEKANPSEDKGLVRNASMCESVLYRIAGSE